MLYCYIASIYIHIEREGEEARVSVCGNVRFQLEIQMHRLSCRILSRERARFLARQERTLHLTFGRRKSAQRVCYVRTPTTPSRSPPAVSFDITCHAGADAKSKGALSERGETDRGDFRSKTERSRPDSAPSARLLV